MSGLKDRIAGLSPEKRAQFEKRLLERQAASGSKTIRRRKEGDPIALSFAQQRLWFLDQLTPGTATYNVAYAVRITGALDVPALERALHALIGRHEVLRTKLVPIRGNAVAVLAKSWSSSLRQVDLRDLPAEAREAEAARLIAEEASRPFNLAKDLMIRCLLVRVGDEEQLLLHVCHHIAWDLRSKTIFYQDLGAFYGAAVRGEEAKLPPLPIQYADYAAWQRQHLQGEVESKLAGYWKQQLEGKPPKLDLPIDKPRPPVQTQRGAKYPMTLSAELLEASKSAGRGSGATLFMTLLAAFEAFLHGLTGAEDISVGSPVAGRNQVETEDLIGFFINTLVLRTKLDPRASFRELIVRVRESLLGAMAHQDLPFDKIVEILRPPRDLSRMTLFQVNFRVQGMPPPLLDLAGTRVVQVDLLDTSTSKFDLALELPSMDNGSGYWEYSTDLFEEATIARMAVEYEALLRALAKAPDAPLCDLPALMELRRRYAGAPLG